MGELVRRLEDNAAPITPTGRCGEHVGVRSKCSEVFGKIFLGGVAVRSPFLLSLLPLGPMVAEDDC